MQNSELIRDLQAGDGSDAIVIVSDENIFNIKAVEVVDGSVIIAIAPVVDLDGGKSSSKIFMPDASGGLDTTKALDVFGDLGAISRD